MAETGIRARLARRLKQSRFGREAMAEDLDLSRLRARPTPRVWLGLGLVALSYLIGWPAVGLFAALSYWLKEPLIVAIGGPLTYGLSHIVFLVGSWLAGAHYVRICLLWATRRLIEKMDRGTRGVDEGAAHLGQ